MDGPDRPTTCLSVHTHERNIRDEAVLHDRHPFVAVIHLLRNAEISSTVYLSAPFLTDLQVVDELCHYAQPVAAGGRHLTIRVIVGPQRWVTAELQRFVHAFAQQEGGCQQREEAIGRLEIRRFGTTDNNETTRVSSHCHSTAMVSTAGAIVGSYNYTYASRYRYREDGCYMPPGAADVESLRTRLHAVWDAGEPVAIRRLRPPPGYNSPSSSKRPKTIDDAT